MRKTLFSRQKKFGITIFLIVFYSLQCQAQHSPLPMDAYGVWIRGSVDNTSLFDDFKGIRANYQWSDIQPDDSLHFKWDDYQNSLNDAYKKGLYVYVSILVGPDSPEWIYDNGVPKVITTDTRWPCYPFYLDPDYKRFYYNLIEHFADFLRTQPAYLADRIAFVQVMMGCTGDVGPYKGTPLNPDFLITEGQWGNFNVRAIEQFKMHFNDGDNGKKIPLLINGNAIHPLDDPVEWEWVNNHIDPDIGFGIKGSAYMRGHHLTGEKEYIDTWGKYLQNPPGMQIFSRGEMDQTHIKMPVFSINKPLAFYWGMLSGLNTSLSVWDITENAIDYAATSPEVQDVFRFFNKYAPQIYPSAASAGYVIFHEGLNSANTTKFPESVFGEASQGNVTRYINICSAYADRGAKMDHPEAATYGQVWQRDNQTGYNDAGWEIEEGNYERWITQIDPDETSVGLFRVRGIIDENSSIYDRFARSFDHAAAKDTMFFKFHDEVFLVSDPDTLRFKITWLDKTANSSWDFRYDNGDEKLAVAKTFTGAGSGQWKTETIVITDAKMKKGGPRGSDFALVNTDDMDDIFHGIEVDIERVAHDEVSIISPQNGDEFILGDSVQVSATGSDLQGIERMRFFFESESNYSDDFLAPYAHTFKELSLGDHTLRVQMADSMGYLIDAKPVTFSVIPPDDTLFIETPGNGDSIFFGEDVLVHAYGYDYDGIENIKFSIDNGSYTSVDTKPYEYLFTGLSEGMHTIDAQMTDQVGDTLTSEAIRITVVKRPDSVSITSPSDGDTISLGENVRVTTYCYDNDGIEKIRFRLDHADKWNNVLAPPYEYTYTGLSTGDHLIEVQMKDVLGNRIWAESVTISVMAPDSVFITSPTDGDTISLGEDIKVTTSCYDSDGIETIGFRVDGEDYHFVTEPPYEYTFTDLHEGSHTIEVNMTDLPGNSILAEAIEIYVEDQTQSTGIRPGDLSERTIPVYPTIVDNVLNWKTNTGIEEICIYNLLGVKVLSQQVHRQGSIELSNLDPGIYLVYFTYDHYLSRPQKIVKR